MKSKSTKPKVEPQAGTALTVVETDGEAERVQALEPLRLPIFALLTALAAATHPRPSRIGASGKVEKVPTPEHLLGVRLIGSETEIRTIGTNGEWVFLHSMAAEGTPAWLREGVTIGADLLKERLSFIDKLDTNVASISFQTDAPYLMIQDPKEEATFRLTPLAQGKGKYPDTGIQAILDKLKLGSRTTADLESVVFKPTYFKGVTSLAAMLGVSEVRVFTTAGGASDGVPTLITFPGVTGAVLLLMPHHAEPDSPTLRLGVQTGQLLDGAITGTIAALRAHRTRWAQKLGAAPERTKKSIQEKIDDYDRRIQAIIDSITPPPTALPAPRQPSEDDEEEGLPALAGAHEETAAYRKKLIGKRRNDALMRFYADTNYALSKAKDGLTLSQCGDGLPLDDWFDAGLTPDEAALRCADWVPPAPAGGDDGGDEQGETLPLAAADGETA
jgi:hypothetical protein